MTLKPASLPLIKATGNVWEVRQDFYRLGKLVHIVGWGGTREEAIKAFERAKFWQDQPESQPFKALLDTLWSAAGIIDKIIRSLK